VEGYASQWNGIDWNPEMLVFAADSLSYPAGGMNLTVDYQGQPHVVWSDYPAGQDIFYSTFDGISWTEKVQVNSLDGGEQDLDPDVAVDSSGCVHVVWAARTAGTPYGYEIHYSQSDGLGWSEELQINEPDLLGDYRARITGDGAGHLWVAWDGVDESGEYHIHAVHYDGSDWSSEYRLDNDATDFDHDVSITTDTEGNPSVLWSGQLRDNPNLDVFWNRYE
jgi:hypothetical protein